MDKERVVYRYDDLDKFIKRASQYILLDVEALRDKDFLHVRKKTVKGLCEYLGITHKTLSKYRQRGYNWKNAIYKIQVEIKRFNNIKEALILQGIRYERMEKMAQKIKQEQAAKERKEYQAKMENSIKGT